ncbi:MAG: transporter [Bacteroidales bacterium]|nr:MAG: transporter [Bacteroidales bacterium]
MRRGNFLLYFLIWSTSVSLSQEIERDLLPELVTDRPDQTESSAIIPLHHLQIESGFILEQISHSLRNIYYNTTILRYGISNRFEMRLGMNYASLEMEDTLNSEPVSKKGFSPVSVGGKIQLSYENGWIPEMALLVHFTIPNTGNKEFTINCLRPSLKLAASHTLSNRISVGYNLGAERDCVNKLILGAFTMVMGLDITEKLGGFIEMYGYTTEERSFDLRSDAGFTLLIKHNLQLDLSGGIGLNKIAPDAFFNIGFSWRIPD